jgi:N-succinyl-L-ornithine transcarbamylase
MRDGAVMDGDKAEHVKEAAAVIGQYCEIIGVRSFPGLADRDLDYRDEVIGQFVKYAGVPVVSLESAIRHPLQSLTDLITIEEHKTRPRPKVVLTWAPHPKALPQAVPNSFAEWMNHADVDFVIAHPEGYELDPQFAGNADRNAQPAEAFAGADFIYAKNWSSYTTLRADSSQGPRLVGGAAKMATDQPRQFMHCLPGRAQRGGDGRSDRQPQLHRDQTSLQPRGPPRRAVRETDAGNIVIIVIGSIAVVHWSSPTATIDNDEDT